MNELFNCTGTIEDPWYCLLMPFVILALMFLTARAIGYGMAKLYLKEKAKMEKQKKT